MATAAERIEEYRDWLPTKITSGNATNIVNVTIETFDSIKGALINERDNASKIEEKTGEGNNKATTRDLARELKKDVSGRTSAGKCYL